MARNPMKLQGLPSLKKMPKALNDANLNSTLPLKTSSSLPSDRLASPASLSAPKSPTSIDQDSLSPRAQKFRRLAGILGAKK